MGITVHTPIPDEKFIEILNTMPICTVDVVFFNKEKNNVLLFKRTNEPLKGVFFSIGGRLLKDEKLDDAAVRQAMREAGINVFKESLIFGGVQEEIHHNSTFTGVSYHAINVYCGYILEKTKITLDSQHEEYKWFSVSDKNLHRFIKSKLKNLLPKL